MTEAPLVHFRRHRFPAEIIAHAGWLYYRFPLSFSDIEDPLAERGINVSFQTVSEWAAKFGLKFAHLLRHRSRGHFSDKGQLDEMVTDKLRFYSAAKSQLMPRVEHRSHNGLNNRAENSHLVVRRREWREVSM